MKTGLATRLVLSHLLVIFVLSGISSVLLLTQAKRYFVDADRRAVLVQAKAAAKVCDDACLAGDVSSVIVSNSQIPDAAVVSQTRGNLEGNLRVNPEGNVSVIGQNRIQASLSANVTVQRVGDIPTDPVSAAAMKGRAASATIGGDVVGAAPVMRDGKVLGVVVVRGNLRNVQGVLGDLRRRILLAFAGGSALAAVLGLWRARSIAKPIRELTVASRAVANGDFSRALPHEQGNDELAQLTRTFGEMRDRVQHELEVRNAFVADASHELRTPLTAIRGAVEILQSGGIDRPEVRDRFLKSLGSETDRLLGLVDGLLLLETTKHRVDRSDDVDVCALAKDVTEQLRAVAEAKSVRLIVKCQDGRTDSAAMTVHGNRAELHQVLVNLLDNAIRFAPPSSDVKVSLSADLIGALTIIEVVDSGPGIPVAERERVFDRFVRLDQSRQRPQNQLPQHHEATTHQSVQSYAGAGLGLAIVRSIVLAHGGTVSFHAGSDGIGTVARVELTQRGDSRPFGAN